MRKKYLKSGLPKMAMLWVSCLATMQAFAGGPPVPSETSKPVAQLLIAIIVALLLVIVVLANIVLSVAKLQVKKHKGLLSGLFNSTSTKAVITLCLSFTMLNSMAQETAATVTTTPPNYGGLSETSYWSLMAVVLLEVVIILLLAYNLRFLLKLEEVSANAVATAEVVAVEKGPSIWEKWWDKINSFKPIKEETKIDLGHNYDGIRELDNRLPPWWLYGFYVTIVFAGIYLWRYHVAHSAPLSKDELKIAMQKGEAEKAAYLKLAANNIDETNVALLTDASDIEAGKVIFVKTCATCHKADAGGSVGPNLTDEFWIHGGSVKDIFKTIKYGVPEKGMQSWKDSYSPKQMAQLTSFIKSIKGSNPPGAKEPQGTVYTEEANAPVNDSTVLDKPAASGK